MTLDQTLLFSLFAAVFGLLLWGRFRYDLVAFADDHALDVLHDLVCNARDGAGTRAGGELRRGADGLGRREGIDERGGLFAMRTGDRVAHHVFGELNRLLTMLAGALQGGPFVRG